MSKRRLALNLRSRWPQVRLLLDFCRTSGKFDFKTSGDEVELQNKKFISRLHNSKSSPGPVPDQSRTNPSIYRERERHTPIVPKGDAVCGDDFIEFWKSYPRKVGKGAAARAWKKIRPGKELLGKMLKAVAVQRRGEAWQKESGRFIPNPATWLNQARWDDEPIHSGDLAGATPKAAMCRRCLTKAVCCGAVVCTDCAWCEVCDTKQETQKLPPLLRVVGDRVLCVDHVPQKVAA